jgi:hypothetical protein
VSLPLVGVVVLPWQCGDLVLRAVESATGSRGVEVDLVVVDNGSKDAATQRALDEAERRGARVHRLPTNTGFARGMNTGYDLVRGDPVVLLNCDAVLHPDALAAAVRTLAEHPDVGVLAPHVTKLAPTGRVALLGPPGGRHRLRRRRHRAGRARPGDQPRGHRRPGAGVVQAQRRLPRGAPRGRGAAAGDLRQRTVRPAVRHLRRGRRRGLEDVGAGLAGALRPGGAGRPRPVLRQRPRDGGQARPAAHQPGRRALRQRGPPPAPAPGRRAARRCARRGPADGRRPAAARGRAGAPDVARGWARVARAVPGLVAYRRRHREWGRRVGGLDVVPAEHAA